MISLLASYKCGAPLFRSITKPSYLRCECYPILKPVIRARPSSSNVLLDVNTNVVKDVLLYSNDGTKHIRMLNIFALGQFIFWNFLAETAFSTMKDTPVDKNNTDGPWYTRYNLGSASMRYSLTAVCLILGNGFMATAYFYTVRAVKYIVLKRGGQSVSIITHSPIGKDRIITVPVNQVSANESRATARVTIPIKIKGKSLFYLLDMNGKFGNLRLFDATVGLQRRFAK